MSAYVRYAALWCFAVLAALLVAHAALAQTAVEVIALKYRSADEIIPAIKPMLAKEGSVSALRNQLVVRTTRRNLDEIRRIVASLDTPPRRLLITVRQESGIDYQQSGARVYTTRTLDDDRNTQAVQVLEGSVAFIRIGESRPVANPQVLSTVIGGRVIPQVAGTVEYRDVTSGFYVRPRVSGNSITVEVSAQREAFDLQGQGATSAQRVATTVSGALGEWIEIASVGQSRADGRSVVLGSTSARVDDPRGVVIKVDEQ